MNSTATSLLRREAHYAGTVQGVGFRYTVRSLAGRFAVAGFVRNLSDGRVQLLAEGEAAELDGFFAAVAAELGHYIRDTKISERPAVGDFNGFEIRR
jgi:acylphosphatase